MKILLNIYSLLATLLFCVVVPSYADDQSLKNELEKAYRQYIIAHESGSVEAIKNVRSSFAFATMLNNYSDGRQKLTSEKIKDMVKTSPDIFKMRFIKIIVNGPTAGLLYVQDSDFIDASKKPRVDFTFIKFVNEPSGWKVDMIVTDGRPKYDIDGKENEFDKWDLPEIAIDGKVLKAPAPTPIPYAAGILDIDSYGYKTVVLINGVEQLRAVENATSGLIRGGLRKGVNEIEILYDKTNKESPFGPKVTIRRIFDEHDIREIFKHSPKQNVEGKHTVIFRIDE